MKKFSGGARSSLILDTPVNGTGAYGLPEW